MSWLTRGKNFSKLEEKVLSNLAGANKSILDSKKRDVLTSRLKVRTWKRIEKEFAEETKSFRPWTLLRNKYSCMKAKSQPNKLQIESSGDVPEDKRGESERSRVNSTQNIKSRNAFFDDDDLETFEEPPFRNLRSSIRFPFVIDSTNTFQNGGEQDKNLAIENHKYEMEKQKLVLLKQKCKLEKQQLEALNLHLEKQLLEMER